MGWETSVHVGPSHDARARCTKIAIKSDMYHRKIILQIRTWSECSIITLEYSEKEPALKCQRQDCAPDSSSLKPGSGATEGVLDKGVSVQPDYTHRPDYRSVKIQDSRLRLVSGWDSPLRGRQAWRSGYYISFLVTDSM